MASMEDLQNQIAKAFEGRGSAADSAKAVAKAQSKSAEKIAKAQIKAQKKLQKAQQDFDFPFRKGELIGWYSDDGRSRTTYSRT
jgi:hypothetical protein